MGSLVCDDRYRDGDLENIESGAMISFLGVALILNSVAKVQSCTAFHCYYTSCRVSTTSLIIKTIVQPRIDGFILGNAFDGTALPGADLFFLWEKDPPSEGTRLVASQQSTS